MDLFFEWLYIKSKSLHIIFRIMVIIVLISIMVVAFWGSLQNISVF